MPTPGALYAKVREPHPRVVDVLLAGMVAVIGVVTELANNPEAPEAYRDGNAFSVTLALVAAVSLVWRRAHPAAVLAVAAATLVVHSHFLYPGGGPYLALLTAVYSVAAYGSTRAARISLAVVMVAQLVAVLGPGPEDPNFNSWGDLAVGVLVVTAVWVWGDSRRIRRLHVEMAEERARRAEDERDEQAREAVRQERNRIAREMHDIVAHSVSVMVVQAGAARRMVGRDTAAAVVATGQIEETGREALREMRRVLGVLRAEEADRVDRVERRAGPDAAERDGGTDHREAGTPLSPAAAVAEPQPRLRELDRLVAQSRDAGLDVRLRIDGDVRPLPSGIELAAYRVVQEALTNTIKHAGPACADVRVRYGDEALTVVVADDGRGAAAEPSGTGHGLPGMRERVAAYGGLLQTGPRPGGGFRVRAELPLDGTAVVSTAR